MRVHFTDIDWDTSDENGDEEHDHDLPTELTAEVDTEQYGDPTEETFDGADFLSDEYGFCVNAYNYETVDDDEGNTDEAADEITL